MQRNSECQDNLKNVLSAQKKQLIASFLKDKHLLIGSDLRGEDKTYYKSSEKICYETVMQLLESNPGTEGTRDSAAVWHIGNIPSYIKDSTRFIDMLKTLYLEPEGRFVNFNVVSLFA